jgi:Eukaryotic aspartyl protease
VQYFTNGRSWVFSTETPITQTKGQTLYRPENSSTATLLTGATWRIIYEDGSGSGGNVYLDTISIGPITVKQQAIESAVEVSPTFTGNSACSGLLGLAFNSLNTVKPKKQATFFSNTAAALASPIFTVNLRKSAPGNYNFGFIDSSEYTGSITYVPITTAKGFWQFNSTGYAIGTKTFVNLTINAIADTGTTLLLLPNAVASAYWAAVAGATYDPSGGGYVFPCTAALPDFIFGIGNYRGRIPGRYLNYAQVDMTTCFGGLQSNQGIRLAVFGDIVLKSQFVVFDAGNSRLGWAPKLLDT